MGRATSFRLSRIMALKPCHNAGSRTILSAWDMAACWAVCGRRLFWEEPWANFAGYLDGGSAGNDASNICCLLLLLLLLLLPHGAPTVEAGGGDAC